MSIDRRIDKLLLVCSYNGRLSKGENKTRVTYVNMDKFPKYFVE